MTISAEVDAEIRRLHFAEHFPIGTISKQLSVHEDVVRRVVGLLSPLRIPAPVLPLLCAPYTSFITDTLSRYPTLRATRVYDMVKERGYAGSVRTLREHVARHRPAPRNEAFLRVESLIGEQAQVDWAHVGTIPVVGGVRALWAFVMVLSWSRAMWAELVIDLTAQSLCRSLVRATAALGGCPRQWLFDNPKIVVIERHGGAARFHPALLKLAGQLHVEPRLCGVRQPQHKGKVERSIRYLRDRFFGGRVMSSIEQGNRELNHFVDTIAHRRPHPRFAERTVGSCLVEEKGRLLQPTMPLPETNLVLLVPADKTAFIQFDRNQYSVPWQHANQTLTLVADDIKVRLIYKDEEIASHLRCWGKGKRLEERAHRETLMKERRAARASKGRDHLRTAAPGFDKLCERWVDAGRNVGNLTGRALKLFDLYGAELFTSALNEMLERGTHDIGALAHLCEQRRRARSLPVPVELALPKNIKDRDVIPHSLESYDDNDR